MSVKHKAQVIVIEDNEIHLRLVGDLLLAHGLDVLRPTDPLEALPLIEKSNPDLVLLDISLKEINGLEIARKLKANPLTARIPVVALSAHATKRDEENALAAGCAGFIVKPIDTRLFPGQVTSFLKPEED
jgi:CheY-like chemotaxis protein